MSDLATTIDIQMPQMGVSVTEGTIVEWKVGVGYTVDQDQTVCDIATDKVDTELPAPAAGAVTALLVQPGRPFPSAHRLRG